MALGKQEVNSIALQDILLRSVTVGKPQIIFDPNHVVTDKIFGSNISYVKAWELIQAKVSFITPQMGLLDVCWDYDYDVYIINNENVAVLISNETLDINKHLRPSHNLFKLWRAHGLGEAFFYKSDSEANLKKPAPLKMCRGDYVLHDGKEWIVFAMSIADGVSVMLARCNKTDTVKPDYPEFKVIIPTPDDQLISGLDTMDKDDIDFILSGQFDIHGCYF